MKTTQYFIPFMIFFFTVSLPSALSLYWLVSGITAYIQQAKILKDASNGKNSDSSEVNASIMKTTQYFIPFMIFFFTIGLPSALSLYWLVSGITAYLQQGKILKQDENDMQAIANKPGSKVVIEGEVVHKKAKPKPKTKTKPAKKRRKK